MPGEVALLQVVGPRLRFHFGQLELEDAREGDADGARVVGIYPLLDLHQPEGGRSEDG